MSWIQALKIWNRGRDVWGVPKGGTKEYDEVIDIMQNNPSAQRTPKRKKAAKAPKQKKALLKGKEKKGKKTAKNPFASFPIIE
jgi:hypothetical protein